MPVALMMMWRKPEERPHSEDLAAPCLPEMWGLDDEKCIKYNDEDKPDLLKEH
jgi:hypothetical protein